MQGVVNNIYELVSATYLHGFMHAGSLDRVPSAGGLQSLKFKDIVLE